MISAFSSLSKDKDFLNRHEKALAVKGKTDKLHYVTIKIICSSKDITKKQKGKIFQRWTIYFQYI